MNRPHAFLLRRALPLLFAATCYLAPAQAVTIAVDPASHTVTAGDSFSLDIRIDNALDVYAFGFDIGFDPTVLSFVSIVEGPFLAGGGATLFVPGVDNLAGAIEFNSGSLQGMVAGVDGSGVLATVNFSALAAGASAISVFNVDLFDSDLNLIALDLADIAGGTVNVNAPGTGPGPLPEPGTWLLMTAGLVGLLAAHRRRERAVRDDRYAARASELRAA